MMNLANPVWIKTKGFLFLFLGVFSASLLIIQHPGWRTGLLLVITIWAFCRFYYFAFYVIEHYLDRTYHFSGLLSFARYLLSKDRLN